MLSKQKLVRLEEYFATQPVDVVYLFGSQVAKRTTKMSDVDIAVLFKKGLSEKGRFDWKLKAICQIGGILETERVDIIDLDQASLKLKYQAFFPKVTIMVKNKSRMVEFECVALKQYLDFQPYLYTIAQRQLELMAERGFSQ